MKEVKNIKDSVDKKLRWEEKVENGNKEEEEEAEQDEEDEVKKRVKFSIDEVEQKEEQKMTLARRC